MKNKSILHILKIVGPIKIIYVCPDSVTLKKEVEKEYLNCDVLRKRSDLEFGDV